MTVITGKKVFAVITGASRGIGRQISLSIAADVAGGSVFVLLSRNETLLKKVKEEIQELNPGCKVLIIIADFSNLNFLKNLEILKDFANDSFESRIIFHNAGSLGDLSKKAQELSSEDDWKNYLQSNFISMVILNNRLYELLSRTNEDVPLFVINITSLCAVLPMPSMAQYSIGKAAREAYFRHFAIESVNTRVLSYSPGPVETDMVNEVYNSTYDTELKKKFAPNAAPSIENRGRLTPMQTVSKLIGIIDKNDFENGSRIDYFDS